jgi:hypothetical protein
MTDRKTLAEIALNLLCNYVAHHMVRLVELLSVALVPPARRALDWLQVRLRPNRNVGITPPAGHITLSKFRRFADRQLTGQRVGVTLGALVVVMTPTAGTLTTVGTAAIAEGSDHVQGTASIGFTARGTLTDASPRRGG